MKIKVLNVISGKRRELELTEEEFNKVKKSLNILERDEAMEVLLDNVLEAFWDYRNKVDYWRLRSLSGFQSKGLIYEIKSSLNRLAFNVLNLSKLFLDEHYHKKSKKCFVVEQTGLENDRNQVVNKREAIFTNNLGYVVGCKLRNRSQHGHLPVTKFSSGFKLRSADNKQFITFKITYNCDDLKRLEVPVSRLLPDIELDLTEILDGYVHAISEMQIHNRKLTEEVRLRSHEYLKEKVSLALDSENIDSCYLELRHPDGKTEEIGLKRFELAETLRKKHRHALDYSKFAFGLEGM